MYKLITFAPKIFWNKRRGTALFIFNLAYFIFRCFLPSLNGICGIIGWNKILDINKKHENKVDI